MSNVTTTTTITEAPAITLTNRLRVANFSSPHPFHFEDGVVLEACDEARSRALSMERADMEVPWPVDLVNVLGPVWAVRPVFGLTELVLEELNKLQEAWDVEVILVPFPMLQALQLAKLDDRYNKAATIIVADRIKKTIKIDRFGR